ncbi:MAG: hypothetical protein KBC35_03640 [Candidatus Pacebacteria bacterium]|jgi:hypothetical protein|nr:hypothetical protein [Candidatus Paceibacterota bacterium]
MAIRFPVEVYDFVSDVAAERGLDLSFLPSEDPSTILVFQPMDATVHEGPNGGLVRKFVEALHAEKDAYDLPTPIHIEAFNEKGSPLPFGITENLPDMVHLVRISTLE